jgi:hypothetical protein
MPERSAARSGLLTTEALAVPLSSVSIDAEISRFCARVAVTQRYINRELQPIEAVYVFPLDDGAAVCWFEAAIDGTLVVGEVKEREEAFRMYDDAMERGDGAFLLDEERPDVFQASIGNLPPGREVLVKLTYVTELVVADGSLRFSIPTTVSPRYAPAEDHRGVGRPDADTLNPPLEWSVPYGLTLSVRVAMGGTISRIVSPSHPISVAVDSNHATVTLAQRDVPLDRDFVLSVDSVGLDAPHAWIEEGEDGARAVAVALVPRLPDVRAPCDVVFLVDRSGSMAGTSINEVRNALQLCLRSMVSGCTFNIVGFGSSVESLFPNSRAYDEASLSEAAAHVRALQADLGGTEILPALKLALGQPYPQATARQIVVLTDGEVTNTDAILALVNEHAARARIFTFGIGAGSSQYLVKALARVGGGTAEFIYPGERIEPKVVRQFSRLLSPALTDVRLDWSGLDVTQVPSTVPPIFAGGRLLLYAFVKEGNFTPGTLHLTATCAQRPVAFDIELDPAHAVSGRTVTALAARARIRELEESADWTTARGSRQRERAASANRNEIITLSVRYGLMSRETSYVAMERRDVPVLGEVKLRRVPIALTTGWGSVTEAFGPDAAMPQFCRVAHVMEDKPSYEESFSTRRYFRTNRRGQLRESIERAWEQVRSAQWSTTTQMHVLVALQHADGSWELTLEFARAIGHDLGQLELGLSDVIGDMNEARRAWATALALAWLEQHARDLEDEWGLLAAKGRTFLAGAGAHLPYGAAWAESGKRSLEALA